MSSQTTSNIRFTPHRAPLTKAEILHWSAHPDRPCKNDDRYTDLALAPLKADRVDMAIACGSCPVYFQCLSDLTSRTKTDHYGIQAGLQGKT